ncbi:GNAT family N-acetyltransferase [Phytohabitans kaempferiae]|uniref:GNAT family N-acetyltransferase n=1 Tax=Phytohabitans kaempferiae TaxID=1620943 RepID=A0ABV6LXA0_9ACTN
MDITPGGPGDVGAVLQLLDGATAWLVGLGRTGQWGTEPHSTNPRRIARVSEWAESGRLHLAHLDGQVAGALAVGDAMPYVPPATEPELYVNLLVTGREYAGRGVGAALLDHARALARERGAHLLRVDCYGGDDRALVGYYERQGFTATDPFAVGEWPGQILVQRLRSG